MEGPAIMLAVSKSWMEVNFEEGGHHQKFKYFQLQMTWGRVCHFLRLFEDFQ
jgi:hypothetical protein